MDYEEVDYHDIHTDWSLDVHPGCTVSIESDIQPAEVVPAEVHRSNLVVSTDSRNKLAEEYCMATACVSILVAIEAAPRV